MSHQSNAKATLDDLHRRVAVLLDPQAEATRSETDGDRLTAELLVEALGAVTIPLAAIADHLSTIAVALAKIERDRPRAES